MGRWRLRHRGTAGSMHMRHLGVGCCCSREASGAWADQGRRKRDRAGGKHGWGVLGETEQHDTEEQSACACQNEQEGVHTQSPHIHQPGRSPVGSTQWVRVAYIMTWSGATSALA